jgi:hypothetical protein
MECSRCDAEFFDDLEYGFPLVLCPRCAEQNEQSIAALKKELAEVKAERDNWHRRAAWYESGDAARDAARYELSNEQLTQD